MDCFYGIWKNLLNVFVIWKCEVDFSGKYKWLVFDIKDCVEV